MDILFLLIPLSVVLALLILGGSGLGRVAWPVRRHWTPKASAFCGPIDFRQAG